jgi:hypothetical protein
MGEDAYLLTQAAQRVKEEETNKRVAFFAVGVEGAGMHQLQIALSGCPFLAGGRRSLFSGGCCGWGGIGLAFGSGIGAGGANCGKGNCS